MKKTKLLLTTLAMLGLGMTHLQSQNYHISFAGTGVSTTVDSVVVKNLTQSTSLTVMGGDTLHLMSTNAINENKTTDANLFIFPNPMDGQTTLSFYTKHDGSINIGIFDISGKSVLQSNGIVKHGEQQYRISGLKQGMYFISISDDASTYSSRLVNIGTSSENPKIESVSGGKTGTLTLKQARAQMDMLYTSGDSLQYDGYSGAATSIVLDVPTTSKTITFVFQMQPVISTDSVKTITDSSATAVATISSDGGAAVTARGFCWSYVHNPTLADSVVYVGSGTGSFSGNMTNLLADTICYVRAFATNSVGTAYGNELHFGTFALGNFYQGGNIFYIDSTGEHGMIMKTSFLDAAPWGCPGTIIPGADGVAIGTGLQNTTDIVTVCTESFTAANYCYSGSYIGYSDWYLPSRDELFLAISTLMPMGIGSFGWDVVWSSSEVDDNFAWAYNPASNTMVTFYSKGSQYYSKPIRNF